MPAYLNRLSLFLGSNRSLLLDVVLSGQDGLRKGAVHLGHVVQSEGVGPERKVTTLSYTKRSKVNLADKVSSKILQHSQLDLWQYMREQIKQNRLKLVNPSM